MMIVDINGSFISFEKQQELTYSITVELHSKALEFTYSCPQVNNLTPTAAIWVHVGLGNNYGNSHF